MSKTVTKSAQCANYLEDFCKGRATCVKPVTAHGLAGQASVHSGHGWHRLPSLHAVLPFSLAHQLGAPQSMNKANSCLGMSSSKVWRTQRKRLLLLLPLHNRCLNPLWFSLGLHQSPPSIECNCCSKDLNGQSCKQ